MEPLNDVSRMNLKKFLGKWLIWFQAKIAIPPKQSFLSQPEAPGFRRPISLRVAAVFNLLNLPLFWLGIVFCFWLVADFVLSLFLDPLRYHKIVVVSGPWVAIAGPAAVGYWTNRLAIQMLFYPKRKNAVWWGLIPARQSELIERMVKHISERLISPEIIRDYLRKRRVLRRWMYRSGKAFRDLIDQPQFRMELKEVVGGLMSDFFNSPKTRERILDLLQEKVEQDSYGSMRGRLLGWTRPWWSSAVTKLLAELPKILGGLVETMLDDLVDGIPAILKQEHDFMENRIVETIVNFLGQVDLNRMIAWQLHKINLDELEAMITGAVDTELVFIQTSGGIFGTLIGLAILFPGVRMVLLAMGVGLYVTYRISVKRFN